MSCGAAAVSPSKIGEEGSLTLFEMTAVVISSEREKSFLTFFIVVDEHTLIQRFVVIVLLAALCG